MSNAENITLLDVAFQDVLNNHNQDYSAHDILSTCLQCTLTAISLNKGIYRGIAFQACLLVPMHRGRA